jgi:hypothetical protein
MANPNSPFGLKAVRHLSGGNIQSNTYPIASGYNTNIGYGDPVLMANDGTITIAIGTAGTPSPTCIGVFGGVQYTDSAGINQFKPFWPANTVATNVKAIVYDDPNIIFAIQSDSTGIAEGDVGQQVDVTIGATNTATGKSATVLGAAAGTGTTGKHLRVLRLVNDGMNAWGAYAVVEVIWSENAYKGVISGVGGI